MEIQPSIMNVLHDALSQVLNLVNIVVEGLDSPTWPSPAKVQFLTGTEIFAGNQNVVNLNQVQTIKFRRCLPCMTAVIPERAVHDGL